MTKCLRVLGAGNSDSGVLNKTLKITKKHVVLLKVLRVIVL